MVDFKIGNVVRLKTGGPCMTVESLSDSLKDRVSCVWFKNHASEKDPIWGEVTRARFEVQSLELVT